MATHLDLFINIMFYAQILPSIFIYNKEIMLQERLCSVNKKNISR